MSSAVIVRPGEAFAHYARALECCAAIGARPLVARTEQAYGKALASAGKTDDAQPHLAAAQQLVGELVSAPERRFSGRAGTRLPRRR